MKFDDTDIEKYKFSQYKSPTSINNIDINKIAASYKFLFGKKFLKHFIGYKDAKKLDLYGYFFQKCRDFDETKYMSFLIRDDELLGKYNGIWEKVRNIIKKEFHSNLYAIKNI